MKGREMKKKIIKNNKNKNKNIKREYLKDRRILLKKNRNPNILIIYNGDDFLKQNNIDGIIRILKNDYKNIKKTKNQKYFTHFNLGASGHKRGNFYILPRIIKQGYYISDDDYELPILDFKNILICKCIDIREKVEYDKIKKTDFKYSMKHINSVEDLKKQIIKRYSKSLPNLSKEEILSFGVSITKLEIIKEFNGVFENEFLIDYIDINDNFEQKKATREGFGDGIIEAKKKNKNIVTLTADLKPSVKLNKFAEKYPTDFYEFSISEQNMMSAAAGMTLNNKIPFVTSFAVFNPGRNWDQLRLICYSNRNVKVIGSHVGLTVGEDGATHQALEDIAITQVLPNLVVLSPCDYLETKLLVREMVKYKGPVYMRVSREKSINIIQKFIDLNNLREENLVKIGKAQVLEKGKDLTIISTGITTQFALIAKKELKLKYGIDAEIINLSTIKPLDKKTILTSIKKTKSVITIEEHQKIGGVASAISQLIVEEFPIKMEMVAVENQFGQTGKGYELLEKYNISVSEIIKKAKKLKIKNLKEKHKR